MLNKMKKENVSLSNQEEFNKRLQKTSPVTWVVLFITIAILIGFFAWGFFFKMVDKIIGTAKVVSGQVTLVVKANDYSKLAVDQKVYISNQEGKIDSIVDGEPVVSGFTLADGEYDYKVVVKEIRPIDFLLGK